MTFFSSAALAAFSLSAAPQTALEVVSISPPANEIFALTAAPIVVQLNQDVADWSVDANSFQVLGRWSGVHTGTRTIAGSTLVFEPSRPFFPGEQVTVSLSRNIQTWSGSPLTGGYGWQYWTRSTKSSGSFQLASIYEIKLPGEFLVQAYGTSAVDLDSDGDPDFSIPCEVSSDVRVFENLGCGLLSGPQVHQLPIGSFPSSNDTADFNGDQRVDLAVANINGDSASVLFGSGAGGYQPSFEHSAGDIPRAIVAMDANADGATDLVIANLGSSNLSYLRNQSNGAFAPAVSFEGGGDGEAALASVDANADGCWDLFVGHRNSQTASSQLGNGNGQFTFRDSTFIGGQSWALAAGDLDGDGDVDLTSANSSQSNVGLAFNDGTGAWSGTQTLIAGGFTIATDLGDIDGDGDLDLVLSNFSTADWTVYRNDGTGQFSPAPSLPATQAGSCMTIVDHDLDGDLDLIGIDETSDQILVFEQVDVTLPGLQAGQCGAQLRVDNLAGSAGFGGISPHPATPGRDLFLSLSGQPFASSLLAIGLPNSPGMQLPFGLLNVSAQIVLTLPASSSGGNSLLPVEIPFGLPPGLELAVQAFQAGRLSNAEVLRLQ